MDKLIAYLNRHACQIKSPTPCPNLASENIKMHAGETLFSVERCTGAVQLKPMASSNVIIDAKTSREIINSCVEIADLMSSALIVCGEIDLKKHTELLKQALSLLPELVPGNPGSDQPPLEIRIAQHDLPKAIFQIIAGLIRNQTVAVVCYSACLCLPLHILFSNISSMAKSKLEIVFAKGNDDLCTERSSIAIVYSDADIRGASQFLLNGHLYFAGHSSSRCEFVLVQQNILAKFTEELKHSFKVIKTRKALTEHETDMLKQNAAKVIIEESNVYETPASLIDTLFDFKPNFTAIIPFRTAKESLVILKALGDKQSIQSDMFHSYKHENYALNLFSVNSNALWQIIELVNGFHSVHINGDFVPCYLTGLNALFKRNNSSLLTTNLVVERKRQNDLSKLRQEAQAWSKTGVQERIKKIREAFPKVELDLALESLEEPELRPMLSLKQYRKPFGIVYLDCDETKAEKLEPALAHCLLAGNVVITNCASLKEVLPESLKNLVVLGGEEKTGPGVALVKLGDTTTKCNLKDFLHCVDVATPVGKELFAN